MIIGCTRQNSIKFARFCSRLHDNLKPNIAGQKLLFLNFFSWKLRISFLRYVSRESRLMSQLSMAENINA